MKLGPSGRLFIATAIGSFCGWFIVEPITWAYYNKFGNDKNKKDLPPPKYQ